MLEHIGSCGGVFKALPSACTASLDLPRCNTISWPTRCLYDAVLFLACSSLKLYYCMNGLVFVGGDGREGLAGGAEDVGERQIDVCLAWGSAGVCCAFFGSGSS